ncbi:MAG: methyltransferase domain-containing protein [Methanoregula sp.]
MHHNFQINNILYEHVKSFQCEGVVVDLGCGDAPYKDIFLEQCDCYIGVDWAESCHSKKNVDLLVDLNRELPFKSNSIDTLIVIEVLEHLKEPNLFLSECYRILKMGGQIFLTVPFNWQLHEEPHDYYRFTRYGLDYLLHKWNFSDIDITEWTGFWQMWALKLNYHTYRTVPDPFKFFLIPLWYFDQIISKYLDKYNQNLYETAGYTLKAKKG